ncbi:MAG: single-stranded-DNA-specific exonuclease RecJ, partial [Pelolinea sp.]|nr:single-stranded-DNA-specific exonuclease RecJ [Pelolinea sp.]
MSDQSTTRWFIPPTIPSEIDDALKTYPKIFRQILFNRGIKTIDEADTFLRANDPLHDPFLLKDFEKAIQLILASIQEKRKIIIFGDYDVDGVTASALLVQVLRQYGADVEAFIPNRFEQGYGLSMDAINEVLQLEPDLIISVDCGVRSIKEVDHARKMGVDVIITDHHQPHANIPRANAVICPKQPGDKYPFKELAGVGIAYKIAQGLLQKHPIPNVHVDDWVDLVAVGTIADLARLEGENRTLVRKGLRSIRFGKRPGLLALANVSGINITEINTDDIGFRIGPRLNAAGRLGSADPAFEILIAETTEEAGPLALLLDQENQKRQGITKDIQSQVEDRYASEENKWILFFWDAEFNEGVVGLAASKLVDRYYRPAIIGVKKDDVIRASCRSIPELNITFVLDECEELLLQHGGHAMAAGLSVELINIDAFTNKITSICKRELEKEQLIRETKAELEVNLTDLHPDLLKFINDLGPLGIGNPRPLFVSRNVKCLRTRKIGNNGDHLKMTVSDGKISFDAIAFRFGSFYEQIQSAQTIDILFS